jgi:type VI protein secretion system component VasA
VSLELDEDHFAGLGDAVIFGGVLDELFAAQAGLNTFAEVSIRLQPSGREYQWPPRNGTRALL